MRNYYLLSLCIIIIALLVYLTRVDTYQRSIQQNLLSNVMVHQNTGIGAGVLVSPHHIITALHVVNSQSPTWVIFQDNPEVRVPVTILAINKDLDLAILLVEDEAPVRPTVVSCETPAIGSEIYAIGAPLTLEWMIWWGRVVSAGDILEKISPRYTADLPAKPGNSGGGAYNYYGQLVGIVTDVVYDHRNDVFIGATMIVSPANVCLFLYQNGVIFTQF